MKRVNRYRLLANVRRKERNLLWRKLLGCLVVGVELDNRKSRGVADDNQHLPLMMMEKECGGVG